jgi:peptidoglycan/LPS O-acetylase OafA/YrhL
MNSLFLNFETIKLSIPHPESANIILFAIFVLASILSIRKNTKPPGKILDFEQTEQIKGLAIFFVISGHLWVHVAENAPSIVLSGDAVAIFLILSGFGLTMSKGTKSIDLKQFLLKRISRLILPYWIATILILLLDYVILDKTLNVSSVLMTFLGLNLSKELRYLDYVRWFVTFIIFWYIIFFSVNKLISKDKVRIFTYFLIGAIILPLNYYIFEVGWYQFLSFPFGCFIGVYYEEIIKAWQENKRLILWLSILGLAYFVIYKILIHDQLFWAYIDDLVPNIFLSYLRDFNSMVFSASIIILFVVLGRKGLVSKLLLILGRYSYELFLLHGVFLVKYNPFMKSSKLGSTVLSFYILFTFLFILSFLLSTMCKLMLRTRSQKIS